MSRIVRIPSCNKCPNRTTKRYYTGDSFEMVIEWTCTKTSKRIALVETFDKTPDIPEWCPLEELP